MYIFFLLIFVYQIKIFPLLFTFEFMFFIPFFLEVRKFSDDTRENAKTYSVCHCWLCNYDAALIVRNSDSKCYLYILHISLLSVCREYCP